MISKFESFWTLPFFAFWAHAIEFAETCSSTIEDGFYCSDVPLLDRTVRHDWATMFLVHDQRGGRSSPPARIRSRSHRSLTKMFAIVPEYTSVQPALSTRNCANCVCTFGHSTV